MNQHRTGHTDIDDKQHLGVFKVDLLIYGEVETFDVRANLYKRSHLVQLDFRKPIVGWTPLAFVDHKREAPQLIVLPEYDHVRENPDVETRLLIETVNLLPTTPSTSAGTETARREGHGCYLSV